MPNGAKPLLFLLEDDPTLREEVRSLGGEAGWDVVECYSVDTACKIAAERANDVCMAFVDMMVPEDDLSYELLRKKLDERDEFIEQCYQSQQGVEFSESKLMKARESLLTMEPVIQALINLDGGAEFLNRAGDNVKKWRVVVFSSRTPPIDGQFPNGTAISNQAEWRQKPVDPEVILQILQDEKQKRNGGAT